jgi:basic membrane protein A and related proteins
MKRAMRVIALLGVAALIASACGNNNNTSSGGTPSSTKSGPTFKVALLYDLGGRGDKSFNDSAAAGLDKAKQDFNIEAKELQPNSGGTNRAELLDLVATTGYQLVIGVGFLYAPTVGAAAAKYPDVKFGDVDGFVDHTTCDTCKDQTPDGNLSSLLFAENEGAYLVGAAAAMKSKSHHIGFIGGVDIDLIKKFQAGFDAGAKSVDSTIKIDHTYISEPPDFSGFNDPAKAQVIAQGMYQAGADVVYHAAGGSGAGLFKAAQEYSTQNSTHVWAEGTDSDQYLSAPSDQQPYILTSNLKRVDVAVYDTIRDFVQGKFTGGIKTFDLKAGGVGYATSGGFVDDIKSQLDAIAEKIKSGEIQVPTVPSS